MIGIMASQAFSPNKLSGLELWLDASDTGTIIDSGAPNFMVSQWNDKSSNNNDVEQLTGANQPSTGVDTINGKNVVTLDDTFLDADLSFMANADFTIYAVLRRQSDKIDSFILGTGNGGLNTALHFGWRNNTTFTMAFFSNDLNITVPAFVQGTVSLVMGRFSQTEGKSFKLIENGVLYQGANAGQTSPLTQADSGHVGQGYNFPIHFYVGDVGEIPIWSRALGAGEQLEVEEFLANKWGFALP